MWSYECCQQICRVPIWERESCVLYGPNRENSETIFSSVWGKAIEQSEPYERRMICVQRWKAASTSRPWSKINISCAAWSCFESGREKTKSKEESLLLPTY